MTARKKTEEKVTEPENTTPTVQDALAAALVEIPAKICVQIGERKRYFDTREEALAALTAFNEKKNKPKGTSRRYYSPEEKAQKAAERKVFLAYAEKQGLEGKKAAMLANVMEDIKANIPELLALVEKYNSTQAADAEGEAEAATSAPEVQDEVKNEAQPKLQPEVQEAVDPLAEFNM